MFTKKWFACELHCHTLHSDGDFSVPELISSAKSRCLDGICLTDHNTMSGWDEAQDDTLAILKGIEWTTYFGHMKVLDCKEYVDWRDAKIHTIDKKIIDVKSKGGIVGIAHPFQLGTPICTGGHWDYAVTKWENVSYIEVWSEGCPYLNEANKKAIEMWHSLLDKGYRIVATFGRDWHRLKGNLYESACTYLLSDEEKLTPEGIKSAIQKGRTSVSVGPLFYAFTSGGKTMGDTIEEGKTVFDIMLDTNRIERMGIKESIVPKKIKVVSCEGEILFEVSSSMQRLELSAENSKWYSFELWGSIDGKENCMLAVTSPIYCER